FTTSQAPVTACAASRPAASACNRAAVARPARRCSAPREPSAAITAQATSRKSARATISSLVTAWMAGSACPRSGMGTAFTVGSSMLPLRGSRRGGVEAIADGDAAAARPLERAQATLSGGLDDGDAQRATAAGDEHPGFVDREHLARAVRAAPRRDARPEQLHLATVHATPCTGLGVVG